MYLDLFSPRFIGAGQMGLGIAYVAALRAKVPVLLVDKSPLQIQKGLSLMDKLLAKDVLKGKISEADAKAARERVTVVPEGTGLRALKDVDMVIEVRPTSIN
jgi:3-hydroxybutyryl-CoA dehydrogenase